METLADGPSREKLSRAEPVPAPVACPAELSAAAAALLDRLAIRLDPRRFAGTGADRRAGILVALRPGPCGSGTAVAAWFAGPVTAAVAEAAAAAGTPVAVLARLCPGGDTAIYALAAAARGIAFRRDLGDLRPAMPRMPHPRIAAGLEAFRFQDADGHDVLVAAPPADRLLDRLDALGPVPPGRVVVTTPRRLHAALHALAGRRTTVEAVSRLALLDADLSARLRPNRAQRTAIVAVFALGPLMLHLFPLAAWSALHVVSAVSFLSLGYLRAIACAADARPPPPPRLPDRLLPSYTVLVALHHEAHMVPGLLAALDRVDYPRDRLEIRLLVEADDGETLAAAERGIRRRTEVAVTICPPGGPRTKPRALCLGLAAARGDLVTVYDAEDRPHPGQLKAAAAAFAAGPAELACLQARLEIDRVRNRLQTQFAIEYEVLFDGLLPWLGARGLPIPLGGTSNHFKREALERALGWDPYNVTEDADLGIRLMRYGHTVDVLDSATREEAPPRVAVWLPQRRRWIKGWMVTWLVHSRRPATLVREIGLRNAAMLQAHFLANVAAPLCHPLGMLLLALHAAGLLPVPFGRSFATDLLFAASVLAILFGYGATMLLARRLLVRRGRRELARAIWAMPLYWFLASLAAWHGVLELVIAPHRWAKTPHDAHDGRFDTGEGEVERVKGIEPSS